MSNFNDFKDNDTEGTNVNITDSTTPTNKATVDSSGNLRNKIAGNTDGTLIGNEGDKLKILSDGLIQGGVQGEITLTTANISYEAKVGASRLTKRKNLIITALDKMFWGYSSGVTTTNGMPLEKNQTIIFEIDPNSTFQVWLVASTATKKAKIAESP